MSFEELLNKIESNTDRAEAEKQYWLLLDHLANENTTNAFYAVYARYLEWNKIYSRGRRTLHKMAVIASKLPNDSSNKCDTDCVSPPETKQENAT